MEDLGISDYWEAFMGAFDGDEVLALCFAQYAIAKRLRDGPRPWPSEHPLSAYDTKLRQALGEDPELYFQVLRKMCGALASLEVWWSSTREGGHGADSEEDDPSYEKALLARVSDSSASVREYAIHALAGLAQCRDFIFWPPSTLWRAMSEARFGDFNIFFCQLAQWLIPDPELAHLDEGTSVRFRPDYRPCTGNESIEDILKAQNFAQKLEFRKPLFELEWASLRDYRYRWLAVYVVGCIGPDSASREWLKKRIEDQDTEPEVRRLAEEILRDWQQEADRTARTRPLGH